MPKVLDLYDRATRIPLVGRGAFSLAFALKAPYFLTIAPTLVELRPNHAEVRVRKWWGVHNHIGTVHVIAVANGIEMAMGALAEASVPAHLRWIPKGMQLEYLAMSDSTHDARSPTPTRPTGRAPARSRCACRPPAPTALSRCAARSRCTSASARARQWPDAQRTRRSV